MLSPLKKQAINHTLHCLAGCAVGEILGVVIGTSVRLNNILTTGLAVILAFFFGYLFTIFSLYRKGIKALSAIRIAIATDSVSIASMELIDNAFIWIVPGALDASIGSVLFWFSLIASLIFAFIFTVPVNLWFLKRRGSQHQH